MCQVTVFFQRSLAGNYQTIVGNGFSTLASWGVVMPPGSGTDDDIGVYLAQEVGGAGALPGAVVEVVLGCMLIYKLVSFAWLRGFFGRAFIRGAVAFHIEWVSVLL